MIQRSGRHTRRAAVVIAVVAVLLAPAEGLAASTGQATPRLSETGPPTDSVRSTQAGTGAAVVTTSSPDASGSWSAVMDWGLQAKHMVALQTGKVLVWSTGANASVWDPASGTLTAAPALFGDLHCAGQSTLADGRVIVVGGQSGSPHNGTSVTSLFDPTSGTWTQGPDMAYLRWYATSTTMADGRVLATSGDAPDGTRATIPEVYNPATNAWTKLTNAPRSQSLYPLMFVLPDGRVYESGPGASTAILDPTGLGSWTAGPSNAYSTSGYSESAVMYAPGKIIRAGGGDPAINRVSVIDMTAPAPAWRDVAPMAFPRRRMNLTILADGTLLAIGGTRSADDATQAVLEAEIWNPASETWTTVGAMTEARMYHSSAVLLQDGRVVVGGGEADGRLRAQVYSPPYLFQGARPTISSAPVSAAYGTTFSVGTPDSSSISSVALIRLSAATHAFDENQRYVPLTFTTSSGSLTVSAPPSGGYAPPGFYQLVIKNGAGVPSVARSIQVDTAANLQPGAIHGTITDSASGLPVGGATVTNGPRVATSDAAGGYRLSNVPAGDQLLTFAASGYATVTRTQTIAGGQDAQLDVTLAPPGAVAGIVTDATTGLPIAGATVTSAAGVATTGSDGRYRLAGVPAGSLTLAASEAAHLSVESTTVVPAGGTATVDFALPQAATFLTGTVSDALTGQPIGSATVSIPGTNTTTDAQGRFRIDVAPGTYTITVAAGGYATLSHDAIVTAGTYAVTDFGLIVSGGTTTVRFAPSADAYVSQTSPTKNYGSATTIRIRQGTTSSPATYVPYLRFVLSGLAGRTVTGANLKLYPTDASVDGGHVYAAGDAWTETQITWANAPARSGSELASVGRVVKNTWVSAAVPPSAVGSDGSYTLALIGTSTDSAYYSSRSGANPPVLELTVSGAPPPPPPGAPTAAFSATPTSGAAPLVVAVTDTSTGGPTSWAWDFGDGTGSGLQAPPAHTYANAGTYVLTLTASNTGGSSSASRTISVSSGSGSSTRLATMTFEGGRLVDPDTGASAVSGSVTLETSAPLSGIASATVTNATSAYLQKTWTAADDVYATATIKIAAIPASSVRLLMLSNQGTTVGNLLLGTTGGLRLRNASTTIGAESPPLTAGGTYRIAIHQRKGTGGDAILEGYVATVGAAFSSPFAASTNGSWSTAADRLRIGSTSGGALSATFDDILVDSGSLPTTALAAPAATLASIAVGFTGPTAGAATNEATAVATADATATAPLARRVIAFVCTIG